MKAWINGLLLIVAVFLLGFITYDLLFSPPSLQEGLITELIYIPSRNVATYTPHQGRRIGDHAIVVARDEQWIAAVVSDSKDSIQVHCTKDHYDRLKVGDRLQYKKYEGQVFHIRYFAHYEDH